MDKKEEYMDTNDYRYATLRYSTRLGRMVSLSDEDTLSATETDDRVCLASPVL